MLQRIKAREGVTELSISSRNFAANAPSTPHFGAHLLDPVAATQTLTIVQGRID
ncbi:hypothetical protein [Maricaulis sp.]|uniref:hypothetical protein n=1 Tax=Maricaulis sp. TaxID=1486257 RepID=UPI003A8D34B5